MNLSWADVKSLAVGAAVVALVSLVLTVEHLLGVTARVRAHIAGNLARRQWWISHGIDDGPPEDE